MKFLFILSLYINLFAGIIFNYGDSDPNEWKSFDGTFSEVDGAGLYTCDGGTLNIVYYNGSNDIVVLTDMYSRYGTTYGCFSDLPYDSGCPTDTILTDSICVQQCDEGFTLDSNNGVCVPIPCEPIGTLLDGIEQSFCAGTIAYNEIWYTELYWACDNTCRGTFFKFFDCDELLLPYLASCDTTENDFFSNCVDTETGADLISTSCTPRINPCDTLFNDVSNNCDLTSNFVVGYPECTYEESVVTNDTIKCVPDEPATCIETGCDGWYESCNEVTGLCQCDDGYTRNSWGECWKDLSPDATEDEIESDLNRQESSALTNEQIDLVTEANEASEVSDTIQNDTLANIANIASDTSNTLDDIKDLIDSNSSYALDDLETELQASSDWIDAIKQEFTDFGTNVETQLATIDSQFNDTKNIFSGAQSFSVPSGNATGCVSFVFHGKTIVMDLCSPLTQFAPLVYFITTLLLMVATFRFIVTHLLKGLE